MAIYARSLIRYPSLHRNSEQLYYRIIVRFVQVEMVSSAPRRWRTAQRKMLVQPRRTVRQTRKIFRPMKKPGFGVRRGWQYFLFRRALKVNRLCPNPIREGKDPLGIAFQLHMDTLRM